MLGLFFHPEDGDDAFIRSVSGLPTNYTALQLKNCTLHNHLCENAKSNKAKIS
jgi:hypothetical protein